MIHEVQIIPLETEDFKDALRRSSIGKSQCTTHEIHFVQAIEYLG